MRSVEDLPIVRDSAKDLADMAAIVYSYGYLQNRAYPELAAKLWEDTELDFLYTRGYTHDELADLTANASAAEAYIKQEVDKIHV